MIGRLQTLTAALIPANGVTTVEKPRAWEDLFLYVTDGAGTVSYGGQATPLKQYDVILATPDLDMATIHAESEIGLLSFYLPKFL